jgi:hypothetical protein
LAYIRNIGTAASPAFQLITDDFSNLSALKILAAYPALADLDGDNDADLLVGNGDGSFIFFENLASPGNFPTYANPVFHYQSLDAGDFSTPQLIDLDEDGLVDLVSGKRNGKLSFYRNTGSMNNPVFSLITESLGNLDVTDPELSYYGYSTPCFFKDNDSKWNLFVGSESGGVIYYKNISDNLEGTFSREEAPIQNIREGLRTGIAVLNADGDSYPDMVIGNYAGGLAFYDGIAPQPIGISETQLKPEYEVSLFPNPASERVHIIIDQQLNTAKVRAEIFRIDGSLCYSSGTVMLANELNIPVNGLSNGIYICRIRISIGGDERTNIFYRRVVIAR